MIEESFGAEANELIDYIRKHRRELAENRITIDSDIDIAVVFKSKLNENDRVNILMHIWEAIENTIPMYYPLEIHIFNLNEFVRLKGRKIKLI